MLKYIFDEELLLLKLLLNFSQLFEALMLCELFSGHISIASVANQLHFLTVSFKMENYLIVSEHFIFGFIRHAKAFELFGRARVTLLVLEHFVLRIRLELVGL